MAEKKTTAERWNEFCDALKMKVASGNKDITMTDEHLTAMEALVTERDELKNKFIMSEATVATLKTDKETLASEKTKAEGDLTAEKAAHKKTSDDFVAFKAESGGDGKEAKKKGADNVDSSSEEKPWMTSYDKDIVKMREELGIK